MTTDSKLREALQKYGQHIGDCSVRAWSTPCFCGLDKTLSPQPPTSEGTPTETPSTRMAVEDAISRSKDRSAKWESVSAAPQGVNELLEAARVAVSYFQVEKPDWHVREMLEKAIDKAATNAEAVVGDADSGTGRFGRNPLTLPSGYVQVPVEPTQDWLDSVANRLGIGDAEMRELHSALLAATPKPSDSKPGEGKCQDQ